MQSVAAVIACEGITHVQLHDYHGGMSLLHLSEAQRPEVLYVAHNAHYNAQFPVPSTTRRLKVTMPSGLGALHMRQAWTMGLPAPTSRRLGCRGCALLAPALAARMWQA